MVQGPDVTGTVPENNTRIIPECTVLVEEGGASPGSVLLKPQSSYTTLFFAQRAPSLGC